MLLPRRQARHLLAHVSEQIADPDHPVRVGRVAAQAAEQGVGEGAVPLAAALETKVAVLERDLAGLAGREPSAQNPFQQTPKRLES